MLKAQAELAKKASNETKIVVTNGDAWTASMKPKIQESTPGQALDWANTQLK